MYLQINKVKCNAGQGIMNIVAHASDFFLWNFQTVGLYIYALEGLECQGQYRAFAGYRDHWEP